MSDLVHLEMESNRFEGGLPEHLGLWPSMVYLILGHNALIGTLPDAIFAVPTWILGLGANQFAGSLPDGFRSELSIQECATFV